MKSDLWDVENFLGMENLLLLCEEARVLFIDNTWMEAGLMNGALGTLKGFMWPAGGDPNSSVLPAGRMVLWLWPAALAVAGHVLAACCRSYRSG